MEFKFKIQDYQSDAVDTVIKVFEGQPYNNGLVYKRDLGTDYTLLDEESLGYGNNPVVLDSATLLHNITELQKRSNIPLSESLSRELGACSLDVEMETGTGKTYVYIKTMFELNKKYGWSKFIVVVPSIAIREGVKKSFEMTVSHFMEYYKKKARFFVYDSDNLNQIESFSSSIDLNVMIINMQAFNTSLKEGAANKAARIIYTERDEFGSRRPIDVIKANRPILILDEPQKMSGDKTQQALKNFMPLFSINYSATHRKKHNAVYVLDALDAYNERLVKKIEVKGFELKNIKGVDGYLFLHEIVLSKNKPPMAKIEFEKLQKSGVKRVVRNFQQGESIYAESGEMEQYKKDYFINSIDPLQDSITLGNGITLHAGDAIGNASDDDIRRIQIRETIASHFEKEEELYKKGIKTLSLFFIDEVAKYRQYDENGEPVLGEYGKIFEEEYQAELDRRLAVDIEDDAYHKYLIDKCSNVSEVHSGYFSIDKNKHFVDSKLERGTDESNDISAFDLIMKNKERLLSFEEPTRFIFSHSALREGWDNPNIFQICTLKHSNNDVAQRQEVGRGLRICVDQNGNRMDKDLLGLDVFNVNTLTVVASDSYAKFVSSLQDDIQKNLAERPAKATQDYFEGKKINISDGTTHTISAVEAQQIIFYLIQNGYVDIDFSVTDKFRKDESSANVPDLPTTIQPYKNEVIKLVKAVFDPSTLKEFFKDARKTKIVDNPLNENFSKKEFQELWKAISPKYVYKVDFDSSELIAKSIDYINKNLQVKQLQYVLQKGKQKDLMTQRSIEEKESFEITASRNVRLSYKSASVPYDLVGRISKATSLTRRTIVEILKGLQTDVFNMFKSNPEDFIIQVSKLINEQKATMVVEHITYTEAKDTSPYDASIFTAEKTERDLVKAYVGKKSVQKYMFLDSEKEESFAKDLEIPDNEVYVYAKLPRGFQIPTPMGNYAPDWAIVFNKGEVKHIFFVAETKGTMDTLNLKPIEKSKIECARKLFKEIRTKDVCYDYVSSYQDLMNIVM